MPKIEKSGAARRKRSRPKRPNAAPRVPAAASESARPWSPGTTLIASVAGVAAGAAAMAAILMRREMEELATRGATDAMLASRAVERFRRRLLRPRPSLLSRILPPIAIAAVLVAAAGSAFFLMAPKPFATSQRPSKPEPGPGAPPKAPDAASPSGTHVIEKAIADVAENGASSVARS